MNTFRAKDENILTKYQKSYNDNITLAVVSRKGLLPQAVFDFISLTDFSFPYIEKVLNKTIKTFTSYKKNKTPLDPVLSEKLLKFFALYNKGRSVFGSVDEFNRWLAEPAFGLGNMIPKDLLETITGIELVSQELTRIEYGDLA
jgi:putative toxin-antitoxin system antitoxin component (TIGR02293 family)